jgi:hypothetical protein
MTAGATEVVTLVDFISRRGRLGAAKVLGCTGPALANALKAGRTIFVDQADDGSAKAFEIRDFPSRESSIFSPGP